MTGGLSTHVLDTARGCPAAGVRVDLAVIEPEGRARMLGTTTTDADGRCRDLLPSEMTVGRYELRFHVADYFRAAASAPADLPFYDVIPIRFAITDPAAHYHVPLLVSPFGYVTYRGS
jgi:5-hydroxyisourate hydrolase